MDPPPTSVVAPTPPSSADPPSSTDPPSVAYYLPPPDTVAPFPSTAVGASVVADHLFPAAAASPPPSPQSITIVRN